MCTSANLHTFSSACSLIYREISTDPKVHSDKSTPFMYSIQYQWSDPRTCAGERVVARVLSEDDKLRRVVLKRVNLDQVGVRSDFLKSGTMARGAAETGKVRHPCHCAPNPPSHAHGTTGEVRPGGNGR